MTKKPESLGISLKDAGLEGNTVIHDKDALASDSWEPGSTPTPWRVDTDRSEPVIRAAGEIPKPIASMWLNGDDAKANAAFIVRACNAHDDLVAALREAQAVLDGAAETERTHKQIEAAIAKAEGR